MLSEKKEIVSKAEPEVHIKKENIFQADLAHAHTQGLIQSKRVLLFHLFMAQAVKYLKGQ